MKLGFVFQKDSHLKAVQATALRLSRQYDDACMQFYALNADVNIGEIKQSYPTAFIDLHQLSCMHDCDYLICCLGGYLLNEVVRYFDNSTTKIIALFPGVVSHYQLDAFISRFNADQVWLNCQADYELYAKLCQIAGIRNNSVLYGASWFFDDKKTSSALQKPQPPITIFFEQTQVITNKAMAQKIEKQLVKLVQTEPDRYFIYKTRENIHNEYLVNIRGKLSEFDNVFITEYLTDENEYQADIYLSVSSSAIIEGLLLGKRCYLLSQTYLDMDTKEIFGESGLFINQEVSFNQPWLASRIKMPLSAVQLSGIVKNSQGIRYRHGHLLTTIGVIMRLSWFYPKMLRLLTCRHKRYAIRKSLEYL